MRVSVRWKHTEAPEAGSAATQNEVRFFTRRRDLAREMVHALIKAAHAPPKCQSAENDSKEQTLHFADLDFALCAGLCAN
jgi:uncharacterized membrane protein YebE (DUF533 family)